MSSEYPGQLDESFVLIKDFQSPRLNANTAKEITSKETNDGGNHPSLGHGYKPGSSSSTSYAHNWSESRLRIQGRHFVDQWGRTCQLRGVNLSGNCKTPTNDNHEIFPANPEGVTFVNRPFPLEEADEHLARLRRWGLTFVRFLVSWEAIEHNGPGQYDTSYLSYLHSLISLFPIYGLKLYISMHQDVWSRYSGGSGAPAWTFDVVGLDIDGFEQAEAAWLKGVKGGGHREDERGLWPTGYQKLAASTMNTVFWGGEIFAPKLKLKGKGKGDEDEVNVGVWLRERFLDAWEVLVKAIGDLDAVVGFEMMNEPHPGYIGLPSLHTFDYTTDLHLGPIPSALQSMLLGAGHATTIPVWTRSFPMPTSRTGEVKITPERSVWKHDGPTKGECIWGMHCVWGWEGRGEGGKEGKGVVLSESYFSMMSDREGSTLGLASGPASGPSGRKRKVDFYMDFYLPFFSRWVKRVRNIPGCEQKWVFVEPIPNEFCPREEVWRKGLGLGNDEKGVENMVFAPHWYDLNALFNKAFGRLCINVQGLSRGMFILKAMYWGHHSARDCYGLQLKNIADAAYTNLGEIPVIVGECGVPMDLNKGEAFRSGDWEWQERMMDALTTGLERALVGFNLWNYNPENDDEAGDDWNGENFSWFSARRARLRPTTDLSINPDREASFHQTDRSLDIGGRILGSVVKPYPAKVAGVVRVVRWEVMEGILEIEWVVPRAGGGGANGELKSRETEIFFPDLIARGRKVCLEGVEEERWKYVERLQTIFVLGPVHDVEEGGKGDVVKIKVWVDPPLTSHWKVSSRRAWVSGWGMVLLSVIAGLFAVLYLTVGSRK